MARSRRPREPRERKSSTGAAALIANLPFDIDDVDTWPPGLSDLEIAVLRNAQEALGDEIVEDDLAGRVIDEADEGMPAGQVLTAGGRVHVLYKAGGGYIRYVVASDAAPCEAVGCCNPRRTIFAGR